MGDGRVAPPTGGATGSRGVVARRRLWERIGLGILLLLVVVALLVRARRPQFVTFHGEAMATHWEVTLAQSHEAGPATEECFARYRELDLELSEWKEGSPLSAVNRAAGIEPIVVPEVLFGLIERSLAIGAATDGAFDVSWAALWGLWDFRAEQPQVPAAEAIEARRGLVDYRKVVLDPVAHTVYLPAAGMKLGLGAIAKGYALDQCATILEIRGIRDFLLVGGGQVVARGQRGNRPWQVGIRDPRGAPDAIFARLALRDASSSTSADNESYFEVDGVRYHHILDPRTGWPARGLRSATVVHQDATLADALSTALMVLGAERGLEVARAQGAEALVVLEDGSVRSTQGMAERIEMLRQPAP